MAISDILWPFERSFSDVPCAREAGLGAVGGGPLIGGLTLILTKNPLVAFRYSIYSGIGIFWLIFPVCRYQFGVEKLRVAKLEKDYGEGKIN